MRYAWIVSSNKTYLPSLNAMLNAIEYYGYKDVDVHVVCDTDIEDYLQAADFSFNVIAVPIKTLSKPGHSLPHDLIYSKYRHAYNIRKDYDAIMHIDCDCLILNNFEKYFEVAASTDLFVCASFPHTTISLADYGQHDADWVHINTPLANFPVFYDPMVYAGMMRDIWEMQPNEQTCSDSSRNHEMYFFNKIIYDHGYVDRVLVLPGNLWVTDAFMHSTKLNALTIAGKRTLFNATMDRIQVIHNKLWKEGIAEGEIARSGNSELCKDNIRKILDMFNFFTDQSKEI